ncbi:MAG: hypothetical protein IJM15_08385 [Erysipelotrichaceae bacterium]|nr:hypothetical protein [Erysipelotrichaceae bacterium]
MKKLFSRLLTISVYALTLMTPALIVQYVNRFVDPMTPGEVWMATAAGTAATLFLAALTGFSGKNPAAAMRKKYKGIKVAGKNEIIIRDPGAHGAETLFKYNDKTKLWESDHGTYLDEDGLKDWLSQRSSDRSFANDQMKKLKNRDTAFDRGIKSMFRK